MTDSLADPHLTYPSSTAAPKDGPRDIVILGSTGSIGTQAVDVVLRNPGRFRVVALSAAGGRPALLAEQARSLGVRTVAVADERAVP
ncbi:1-deoxy-D-xylulose-5-phosphate reductoisomerase, partial [Streptomyces sp. DJ]